MKIVSISDCENKDGNCQHTIVFEDSNGKTFRATFFVNILYETCKKYNYPVSDHIKDEYKKSKKQNSKCCVIS